MERFRSLAQDLGNDENWYTGIACLSICGTKEDLAWMGSLQKGTSDRQLAQTLRIYIPELEKHLGLPLTPNPPLPAAQQTSETAH